MDIKRIEKIPIYEIFVRKADKKYSNNKYHQHCF